jgi:DNA-binding transcriptional LysR family regulator
LPDWLVAGDVAAGRLKILLRKCATPPMTISAIHRTELRSVPRVRAFIDHMIKAYEREGAEQRHPGRGATD